MTNLSIQSPMDWKKSHACSILTCKKIHGDTSDPDITLGSMVPVVAKQLSGYLYISGPFTFPWTSGSCG